MLRAAILALLGALAICAAAHAAQYRAPRTVYGQPDLQGLWTTTSLTGLERDSPKDPLTFATRAQENAFEAAAMVATAKGEAGGLGQGVSEWHPAYRLARIDGKLRTSWLTWPADGRLPYRPETKARYRALGQAATGGLAANPEDRPPTDRCLLGGFASNTPPMINPAVAAGKQIVQTRTEVAILSEMNHDVRIVRLRTKNQPARHPPANIRVWMGNSIGHWEGETLVVETTNFHPQETFRGPVYMISPDARVTERFTRVGPHEMRYAFEVDDPATFTEVWKGEMPLKPDKGPIFEFACHEGNYSMPLMLQVARHSEAATAETK